MRNINKFYVSKLGTTANLFFGYSWSSGSLESTSNMKVGATSAIEVKSYSRFIHEVTISGCTSVEIYDIDEEKKVIRSRTNPGSKIDIPIKSDVYYIAIELSFNSEHSRWVSIDYEVLRLVNPYYKNIKKQYKKESNQMFFRESIDGKITLRGSDFEYINNTSMEDNMAFYIYRNDSVYAVNEFNKTDCVINHSEGSIELRLKPKDTYDKILNSYDKTHDLLKMPIRKSAVKLTKRCAFQFYFEGENTITNYAGGTYWEDEVKQAVSDANSLQNKYYFSKVRTFNEINLKGFNYDELNTVFRLEEGKSIWNGTTKVIIGGTQYILKSSIVFKKVASAGSQGTAIRLSDGVSIAYRYGEGVGGDAENPDDDIPILLYDTYRIEIYNKHNGEGRKLYQSESLYGKDNNYVLKSGQLYKMVKVSQDTPYKEPEPSSFYLGQKMVTRYLWGRLLCDVSEGTDGTSTYDLPIDDFASERNNFTKCIGLKFANLVYFTQSEIAQKEPTPYGVNDNGEYFVAPRIYGDVAYELYPYPFARSTWLNTSLWIGFEENENLSLPSAENFRKKFYKTIIHKDCMEIGAVIKALLEKLDSTIKFDSTSQYSQFLYGSVDDTIGKSGHRIYITQKSNVLKGEYDQAAQKGEITFGQVMSMLKNCFRCYWYIDSNRRFRIEHVRYFMNGLSYSSPAKQYDLSIKYDKFNKKPVLYGQHEISYSKSELKSRYEFAWSDDTTEMMGGGFSVDVESNYIEQGSTENINVELFTPDIDFMMFAPERFSQDGFALMITDSNNNVPIVYATAYNQQNPGVEMTNYVQNYYASFLHLFNNYLYDMPARTITSSVDSGSDNKKFYANGLKKFVQHNITFQPEKDPDLYKVIGTLEGEGSIDNLAVDIDTGLVDVTLVYAPK